MLRNAKHSRSRRTPYQTSAARLGQGILPWMFLNPLCGILCDIRTDVNVDIWSLQEGARSTMPAPARKTIQLRMSAALYSQARQALAEIDDVSSFNDFAVKAIKDELRRIEEARIDAAFSQMGKDEKYLRATADISRDFVENDRQTLEGSKRR